MNPCGECGDKPALFKIKARGAVKADKKHDLCFRCARAYINRFAQQKVRRSGMTSNGTTRQTREFMPDAE